MKHRQMMQDINSYECSNPVHTVCTYTGGPTTLKAPPQGKHEIVIELKCIETTTTKKVISF